MFHKSTFLSQNYNMHINSCNFFISIYSILPIRRTPQYTMSEQVGLNFCLWEMEVIWHFVDLVASVSLAVEAMRNIIDRFDRKKTCHLMTHPTEGPKFFLFSL